MTEYMYRCRYCHREFPTEELTRHVVGEYLIVHCPGCHAMLGHYRQASPAVDRLRDATRSSRPDRPRSGR